MGLMLALLAPLALAAGEPLSAQPQVRVERIRIDGNTVLDEATLRAAVAPYEHRDLAAEELEELRQRLTQLYVDAGYISSGALIPDQSLDDGVLRLQVTEGRLTRVQFTGEHHYREAWLQGLFTGQAEEPLNVGRLQERMQLLLQDGVAEQLNAELLPGDAPGQSQLRLGLREGPRFHASLDIANDRPVSVGETAAAVELGARNLLGINDLSVASMGLTDGYESYGLRSTLPLPGTAFSLFASVARNDSSVVESRFRVLDISSRETAAEAGFGLRLQHTQQRQISFSGSLYHTRTRTYLLGIPFSFAAGVVDGEAEVSGLRTAVDAVWRWPARVFAARSLLNFGLDAFGSTIHADPALPDSHFASWQTQLQLVQQVFDGRGQALARAGWQLASDGLLPSEKLVVGGGETVRGYRENYLVRDEGLIASAEYRHRLARLRVPGISRDAEDGALALALFIDYGLASDDNGSSLSLASVGSGLRWNLSPDIGAQVYHGIPFIHEDSGGSSLQDEGVHFRVHCGVRF
ncbi:MAG TPA: ShlB/FhaC/HecB family hemolysin secretion/activation protein [Solimonas sp.]|nr:ShlB/FhaC/HecB family hemolysin secretion/activation protein [Solimonas sp.]